MVSLQAEGDCQGAAAEVAESSVSAIFESLASVLSLLQADLLAGRLTRAEDHLRAAQYLCDEMRTAMAKPISVIAAEKTELRESALSMRQQIKVLSAVIRGLESNVSIRMGVQCAAALTYQPAREPARMA